MQDFDWEQLPRRPMTPFKTHPKVPPAWGLPRSDGRKVRLQSLHQAYIYANDLLAMTQHPASVLEPIVARARKLHPAAGAEPVVLPPVLLEFEYPWFPGREIQDPPFWLSVTLPRVASIAEFFSSPQARDPQECFSSLVVIWFQEGFGNPDEEILKQIAALDWNALAYDWTP